MNLTIYNFTWRFLEKFILNYLKLRIKKGKENKHRIRERFGLSMKNRNNGHLVWLHGSSVGESIAAIALAKSMLKNGYNSDSESLFLITTNTTSSEKVVKSYIKEGLPAIHQFHPFDHPKFVKRFLNHWRPDMAVFMESDFWPNLIYETSQRKIPTILASSQMSKKSSRFWRGLGFFLAKTVFSNVDLVLAVDPNQAELFKKLGAKNIKSLTSLKSIAEKPVINVNYVKQLKSKIRDKNIFLASCTHPGEEEILIDLAKFFRKKGQNNVIIIIVPRHIDRSNSIEKMVRNAGFDIKCRSKKEFPQKNDYFYLADTMGEMGSLIEVSNLVFVAGSMVNKIGGHNPAEAANFGKAIIMGPFTEKCNAQINDLVASGGGIKINNEKNYKINFLNIVSELINQPHRLNDMGKNALEAVGYAQMRADEASEYLLSYFEKIKNDQ